MKNRVVDLFAGGGGLSLGFTNAGYNLVGAFDSWAPACEIYAANFTRHPIIRADLSRTNIYRKVAEFNPNIIIGGPPCQDFSSAGKRDESLGRANLTLNFAHIIRLVEPFFFVMENVGRAINSRTFAKAKQIFKRANYGLTIRILNASLCGVPQSRKRIFVIGQKNGPDEFLAENLTKNLSQKPLTLEDFFGDKLHFDYYYRHPRSYKRRAIFSVYEPSPTIRGVNRPVPEGYPGHSGDAAPLTRSIRALTSRERCMIQTFPENYALPGNKTQVEQIIGNAVPVKLAEYVALRLKEYIKSNRINISFERTDSRMVSVSDYRARRASIESLVSTEM